MQRSRKTQTAAPPLLVVALDCDGVVLESVEAKTRAFGSLFAGRGPGASEFIVAYHREHGGVSRYRKFEHFYRAFLGCEITPEEMADLDLRFSALCLDEVLQSPLVPGVAEFLAAYGRELPLYVVSGAPQAELREIFARRALTEHFQAIYGSPDSKTEILARVIQAEGVAPSQVLMVGDSSTDRDAALAVGALFYGRGEFPGHPWSADLHGLTPFVAGLLAAGCAP